MKASSNSLIVCLERFPVDTPGSQRILSLIDCGYLDKRSDLIALNSFDGPFELPAYSSIRVIRVPRFFFLKPVTSLNIWRILSLLATVLVSLVALLPTSFSRRTTVFIYTRVGYVSLPTALISRLLGFSVILDCTEVFSTSEYSSKFSLIGEFLHHFFTLSLASHFFCISKRILGQLKAIHPRQPVTLVYPSCCQYFKNEFIKYEANTPDLGIPDSILCSTPIVYFGNFKKSDDPHTFLDALALFYSRTDNPKHTLVVSSVAYRNLLSEDLSQKLRNLCNMVASSHGQSFIHIIDRMPLSSYLALLHRRLLLVVPRASSGFARYNQPMRLAEFSLSNNFIVSTAIEDLYQQSSPNLFLYQTGSAHSLASVLSSMIRQS
jgi:hypothetical protein